ncbi:Metallophosphoesterase MPPED2 [Tritrichomonas foetus]|uniref:Metallophosphoesterase MPPED2 n=1 Tax=Tritrichomonas foetus TaxID=1144522 RepID=A0A1J4J9V9_9EUKA|nr:Metallophosphoesterase MPPED2 [Tritrichomonas foetus]|eukprot:OHS94036.1 Metallophosphoesterase MPPED2 [Tritrichomonas foetus]
MFNKHQQKFCCHYVEDLNTPKAENSIRLFCFSDTHSQHDKIPKEWIHPADIALFAGDFSNLGSFSDTQNFISFFSSLPCTYKVMIAGNHELTFDVERRHDIIDRFISHHPNENVDSIKQLILESEQIIYLEDSMIELMGVKIYGSPYSPFFCNWAFPTFDQEKGSRWKKISNECDVLLVHGPPKKILDLSTRNVHCGCPYLGKMIKKINPALCVFGHIHETYGLVKKGKTTFANVSTLNVRYEVTNKPMIFDLIPNAKYEK